MANYEITVHRADPIHDEEMPTGAIHIDKPQPCEGEPEHRFQTDAEAIADVLWNTLPGGTIDRLVAEMLRRHASLLRVRRTAPSDAEEVERD